MFVVACAVFCTCFRSLFARCVYLAGGGPFANNSVLFVHRNDPANPEHAFASIGWPSFVGAITGVAQNGIGISEKVWEVC